MSLRGQNRERAVNELLLLKDKKNPNIVSSLDSFLVDGDLWLVMEYMDGGTLQDVVRQTRMAEGEMAAVSREVRDPACDCHALDTMVLPKRA
ncbi:serine/threonine-protein kinase PAK 3-like [Anomalospiza imberbis]|uniref:serine/threonine-protein kinase PAK 3-like n=1 Tax=Anomalospiza imberbis TaxID=187417 RepID=UPI00358E6B20